MRRVIMIVDDDDFMRNFIIEIVRIFFPEAKIIRASNGKEASDKLERFWEISSDFPDTILTDFEMPVMNGLELLRFIRSHANPLISNLRVVMVSGNCSPALIASVANLNCQFLEKPVRLEELTSALSAVLKK